MIPSLPKPYLDLFPSSDMLCSVADRRGMVNSFSVFFDLATLKSVSYWA